MQGPHLSACPQGGSLTPVWPVLGIRFTGAWGKGERGNVEEGTPAHRRRAGEREAPRDCSPVQPRPRPPPPHPSGLTLLTVAPSKARAASPLQRRHRAVGHSVCGSDQSPVTNTRAASGQCKHLSAAPGPAPAERPAQAFWELLGQ